MKPGWKTIQMGQICTIQSGKSNTQDAAPDGPYAFFDRSKKPKRSNRYLYECEALIIPGEGTQFLPTHFSGKFDLHQRAYALFGFSEQIEIRFLFHYLHHMKDYFPRVAVGATVKSLRQRHFEQLPVVLPPLAEQRRIVAFLDEAFAGIATARANAEKNLQNARALFESHLNAVFTQRGEGWVEMRLGDKSILEMIDGDRGPNYPQKSDFADEGHCLFLNTKNVRPDGFDFTSRMFISESKDGTLRKGKLRREDVVLTTRGTIGNIALYSGDVPFENIRINSGMLIFRPQKSRLSSAYLFELFRSDIVKEQIRLRTTGTAQPQLPVKTLVDFIVPIPPTIAEQEAIVESQRALGRETHRLESIYQRKIAALDELKKSVLHEAFSTGK